ncbi:GNAT family protein [Curvibacter sp. HBC28]|uniref:GNAT family protein n=1 Tax=Curvibacter microcysteis TaxID=3026419 RepID=A0ABT5MJ12_9BURK|nr:GNAT family protein [Curvibacter sp. HBC28]MDD0816575.1 GNAT family protein [Curvibacter sp. HBC28]
MSTAPTDIRLREIESRDLPFIHTLREPEVVDHLGAAFRHVSTETDAEWLSAYRRQRDRQVRLVIEQGTEPMGVFYLLGIDWIHRSAEFAMALTPSARGRGVGTEAARQGIAHAFQDLNLSRLHLSVLSDNLAAKRLYQKVGFVCEGLHPQSTWKHGAWKDSETWALRTAARGA